VFFIVAFVLLVLLPAPWNFVGFVGGLVVFVGEVLFWNRKVRGQQQAVGAQMLIGKTASVVSACSPDGQVRISGEIWAARCSGGAGVGETVTVVGREGLTLVVEMPRKENADALSSGH
jgi:membrane protein implicated in regulation of membrane protease activity